MSHKTTIKPLAIAMGAVFATSLAATPIANAAENPFTVSELSGGYMVADGNKAEGKCGAGKMGGMNKSKMDGINKTKEEGKCGEGKAKSEGKCGGGKMGGMNKSKMDGINKTKTEGKCGESHKAESEGKCGGSKK